VRDGQRTGVSSRHRGDSRFEPWLSHALVCITRNSSPHDWVAIPSPIGPMPTFPREGERILESSGPRMSGAMPAFRPPLGADVPTTPESGVPLGSKGAKWGGMSGWMSAPSVRNDAHGGFGIVD